MAQIPPKQVSVDDKQALKGLAALGLFGVFVPEEFDGAGLDYTALAVHQAARVVPGERLKYISGFIDVAQVSCEGRQIMCRVSQF